MKYEYTSMFVSGRYFEPKRGHKHYSKEVDGVEFTRDVQATIHNMATSGYELHQTIPLISTAYHQKTYTEGVTLIFRKEL